MYYLTGCLEEVLNSKFHTFFKCHNVFLVTYHWNTLKEGKYKISLIGPALSPGPITIEENN